MSNEPFNIPELRDSVGLRLTEQDKRNLRLLMVQRRETSVSNIIKWCVEQQAAPVRQRMRRSASLIAKEENGGS